MNKDFTIASFISENSRPLSSLFYFTLIMTIFCAASPEVFFATKFHQAVLTVYPIIIFLVIPLVFVVTMGEIDLSFASNFAFASWIFALLINLQCRSIHCSSFRNCCRSSHWDFDGLSCRLWQNLFTRCFAWSTLSNQGIFVCCQ